MSENKTISGFSKLSKRGKIKWIVENFFKDPEAVMRELMSYWHSNEDQQKILDGFSENTISNYPMPFGVAPNFVINGFTYCIPMVIEESSVVAASASAAKFWMSKGGFRANIIDTRKIGQIHFIWPGNKKKLKKVFDQLRKELICGTADLTRKMHERGGGILDIHLLDFTDKEDYYYQIKVNFDTRDSMGANFINSVLEKFSAIIKHFFLNHPDFDNTERDVNIIMSILSNYTPECLVRAWVECPVDELGIFPGGLKADQFADKFLWAVRIAKIDPYRATTHNKGIFNGIDAIAIATGNDFRAIEACGHTYAARDGQYKGLTDCTVENGIFKFWLDIPISIGTVGGLTSLHPIARRSLELLGNPGAKELMQIIAVTGLAQNFAAIKSLVTTGIQKGHMKMHLINILNHLGASEAEIKKSLEYFKDQFISYSSVREYISKIRNNDILHYPPEADFPPDGGKRNIW